jgi:hypothetical protein
MPGFWAKLFNNYPNKNCPMVTDLNVIIAAYELARQRYASLGMDVEYALEVLSQIPPHQSQP